MLTDVVLTVERHGIYLEWEVTVTTVTEVDVTTRPTTNPTLVVLKRPSKRSAVWLASTHTKVQFTFTHHQPP
ncbi:hypothetical protein D3C85_1720790 [compost metagenome]